MKRYVIGNVYIHQMISWRSLSSILTYTYPMGGEFQNIQYSYFLL